MFRAYINKIALEWARTHLPPAQYHAILESFKTTFKCTLIVVIGCIPIITGFCLMAIFTPFSNKADADAMPYGATTCRTARVDYDGNFYWTYDSKKYEEALEDFGLNPDEFNPHDTITIYIDDEQNVYMATETEEGLSSREIEMLVGVIGAVAVPFIIIVCIYVPIAYTTFGKPWRMFMKEYNRRN